MTSSKNINKVIKKALKRGWYLIRNKNHLIFGYENGSRVTLSKTPKHKSAFIAVERDFLKKEQVYA